MKRYAAKAEKRPTECTSKALAVRGVSLSAVLLTGCASQGPLRPPSLNLPAPVRGFSASRVGDRVELTWTNPSRTTDGLPLVRKHAPGSLQAEICRAEPPGVSCVVVGHAPVIAGARGSLQDALPAQLVTGSPRLLEYRVRVLNAAGKGAASTRAVAVAGTAPEALQHLRAQPVSSGVLVQWQAAPGGASGEDRVLLRVYRGGAVAAPEQGVASESSGAAVAKPEGEVLLAAGPAADDAGGTIDTDARQGTNQQYSVVRTRTVRLNGEDMVVSSAPAVVVVSAEARRPPPAPPVGLEAVVNTVGSPEIDLVWQPGTGDAYRVYRAEGNGSFVLLTPEPVRGLTYSDKAVRPGSQYRYRVSSVDSSGVAGPESGEISERVPDR